MYKKYCISSVRTFAGEDKISIWQILPSIIVFNVKLEMWKEYLEKWSSIRNYYIPYSNGYFKLRSAEKLSQISDLLWLQDTRRCRHKHLAMVLFSNIISCIVKIYTRTRTIFSITFAQTPNKKCNCTLYKIWNQFNITTSQSAIKTGKTQALQRATIYT